MKKGAWSAEQQAELDAREVKDELLNAILGETIKKMEENPYCHRILENAGYYKTERPDEFDVQGFHLEKIYIGHGNEVSSPQGHCTKEIFGYMNKQEENKNGNAWQEATRDAVYLGEGMLKTQVMDVLRGMGENGERILRESGVSFGENKTYKERYKDALSEYEKIRDNLRSELNKNRLFREQFFSVNSDVLLCTVAHECVHGGQMQKKEWGAQTTRSLFRREDIDKEADYNCGRHDYKRKENGELLREPDAPAFKYFAELLKSGKLSAMYSEDNMAEAGVMAPAYVAFMELKPSPQAIELANELYDDRLGSGVTMKDVMNNFKREHGEYEAGNPEHQQTLAQSLCGKLLEGQAEKTENSENGKKYGIKIDYSDDASFDEIKASYRPEFFGSACAYAATIPAKLTAEQIGQLERVEHLWQVRNKLNDNKKVEQSRKLEPMDIVRNKLIQDRIVKSL